MDDKPKPDFVLRLMRAFLKIVFSLLVVGVLVWAGYLTLVYLYPRVFAPVQANTADILKLASQQDANASQANERLSALETSQADDHTLIATLENRLGEAEQSLSDQDERLQELAKIQESMNTLRADLDIANNRLDNLDQQMGEPGGKLGMIERQLQALRLMELLANSRLALDQNNPGLAVQNLTVMRELFTQLADQALPDQQETLAHMQERLELALSNLPDYPVLAEKDLEILWEQLLLGLPGDPGSLESLVNDAVLYANGTTTPSPTPSPTPLSTQTLTPAVTPTAQPTH